MGCDIHGYVDYDDPKMVAEAKKGEHRVQGANQCEHLGAFHIGRNYTLFGFLAGVRDGRVEPVAPQKGLPERLSYTTKDAATLYVVEDDEYEDSRRDGERCCSRSNAEGWGGNYFDEDKKFVHHPDWHSHSWLTTEEVGEAIRRYCELKDFNMDFLSKNEDGTWPDIPEGYKLDDRIMPDDWRINEQWRQKIKLCPIVSIEEVNLVAPPTIVAIHAAMKSLEASGMVPRFVFWFDN